MKPADSSTSTLLAFLPAALLLLTSPLAAVDSDTVDLLDLGRLDRSRVVTQDAVATTRMVNGRSVLRIVTGHSTRWPGVTLRAPDVRWNLAGRSYLSIDLRNAGSRRVKLHCRIDNPGADGARNCITETISLDAGERGAVTVLLAPRILDDSEVKFIGMRGDPPVVTKLDPENIQSIVLFVMDPVDDHEFELEALRAGGTGRPTRRVSKEEFFPFIDELGQYLHANWPGKTRSVKDLVASAKAHARVLDADPGPSDRNRYGGWTSGPKLESTGFFRVEKHLGKWWLVDPEGRLFWSHGIDCVNASAPTPISHREHYFRNLPAPASGLARFYGTATWAPLGYYRDHAPYRTFDFFRANLLRKYGESWESRFVDVTHRRLRSWGLNTIGNWSDSRVYRARRTPYVVTLSTGRSRRLEGSRGHWGKFPDVFSADFRDALRARVAREKELSIGDPWCVGFFVDNELSWGDETSLAIATLLGPPDQPAKRAFVDELEARYISISKLNASWQTRHMSWKALLDSREAPPEGSGPRGDLAAFNKRTAETYFRTVRDELRAAAPGQLYLGCRFAWVNDQAARSAAKFCDVVGYNRYEYSVERQRLPDGIDRPIIIGEFHFGALDRGLFHTGLRKARDQKHRADLYESYVLGALRNPLIVGTHWFQWKDQATTGRADGENYQIGFIDICDQPYPEIVRAARDVAARMYPYRLSQGAASRP